MLETIIYRDSSLCLIDQRKLPFEKEYFVCTELEDVIFAIKEMVVRGAPAIGVTAAFGFLMGINEGIEPLDVYKNLLSTRPTAVNLLWALGKMKNALENGENLEQTALDIYKNDILTNKKIGEFGSSIVGNSCNILTHCNAGALATAGYGTAIGVIRYAHEQNKKIHVYVDETRPFLQGARLTAFELNEEGIENTLICDNMAGYLMSKGKIDVVIVGADRIAKNGDVANKIGTYSLAVLANFHNVPFFVAAPFSTVDMNCENGAGIVIEQRDPAEVRVFFGRKVVPESQKCLNPAFDVTPGSLVCGIITERGIIKPSDLNKIHL